MNPGQSSFLQSLGWALLNSLWQMALLWMIVQIVAGLFRKASSAQKSALATSAVMIGFGWFVYTFISICTARTPDNGALSVTITPENNEQLNSWLRTMLPVASLIYLALLVLPLFNYIRNYRYVQAIRRFELSKADIGWRIFVKNVSARIGIKKPVHVWLSGLVTSPVTIGYLKPVILLPVAAVNHLSPQQIEAVLLHELAHIRRYDYLLNLVVRFIHAVLYFNPFVKALVKTIEREREKSCDEMVMQFQYDPYGYASALLTLEKVNHHPKSLVVAASGRKNDLLHRIECLMGVQKKQVISFNRLAGLLAGLLCFIALNALLILTKPHHQNETVASLTRLSSPFYIYTGGTKAEPAIREETAEIEAEAILNNIKDDLSAVSTETAIMADGAEPETVPPSIPQPDYTYSPRNIHTSPSFVNVALTVTPPVPQLKEYQEEQVKSALEASKKVLEEKQWKALERKIAEVMTLQEKNILKCEYEKQMDKIDWNKLGDKLRVAYDNIEWNTINDELNKAMTEIKIDSMQQVYTMAVDQLNSLKTQLCESNLSAIPDTDISLKTVEQTKKEIEKAIKNLIRVKTKKIVHL